MAKKNRSVLKTDTATKGCGSIRVKKFLIEFNK